MSWDHLICFSNLVLENWKKVNDKPVCFGAKDDSYGNFSIKEAGLINTFKLVHRSGAVRCSPNYPASYWGCTVKRSLGSKMLATVLTYKNKTALLLADYTRKTSSCGFKYHTYSLNGITVDSKELVFNQLPHQLSVSFGQEFQIWYAEDLNDCTEQDNSGETCADVYARYD